MSDPQILQDAGAQVRMLAEGAGIRPIAMAVDLTDAGRQLMPSMLSHQLAADHAVKMRLVARLDRLLARMTPDQPEAEQVRDSRELALLCAAAARFTERFRQGLISLARLQRWPGIVQDSRRKQAPKGDVDPGDVDPGDDDPTDDDPDGGKSVEQLVAEMQAVARAAESMLKVVPGNGDAAGPAPANRGKLRHGNRSGDFLAAPRCGACTRAGAACRQPAMKNGRCRMHGGKSTGARTAEGLARCRSARLVHGHRTAEVIELKSELARRGRRLAALTRLAKSTKPRSERPTPCPATTTTPRPVGAAPTNRRPTPPARRSLGEGGCPATPPELIHVETRRRGEHRSAGIFDFFSAFSAAPRANPHFERPTPCPAGSRRRSAAG